MEIYQLKTFSKVAEEGNITRAAQKLFTSQPAVSAHIKSLEEEFGVILFDRTSKGMILTSAGEVLLRDAKAIIAASKEISRKAISLRDEVSGALQIGLNNGKDVLQSDQILTSVSRRFPRLGFDISDGDSGAVLAGLENGDLDVGFYEGPCTSDLMETSRIGEIELCIAVPRAWFEELNHDDWSALARKTWMFGSPQCSYSGVLKELEEESGSKVEERIFLNDASLILDFVKKELALCIAPLRMVAQEAASGDVMEWPFFSRQMPISIACLKSRAAEPAIAAFIEETKRVWEVD